MSKLSKLSILVCMLAGVSANANAIPLGASRGGLPTRSAFMAEGEGTLAPLSHVRFCMDHGEECTNTLEASASPATLDVESFPLLDEVNRDVNARIRPHMKNAAIGWAINPAAGDCNDYAVSKRHELIARGIPASALRLAVVRTSWGEGHLILLVRTELGDQVLDNLSGQILPWTALSYRFLKVQSGRDPAAWVSPVETRTTMATLRPTIEDDWFTPGQ